MTDNLLTGVLLHAAGERSMSHGYVSEVYLRNAIEKLDTECFEGPIDFDVPSNWIGQAAMGAAQRARRRSSSRQKGAVMISRATFNELNKATGVLSSSLMSMRHRRTKKKLYEINLWYLYRNTAGGAKFGMEYVSFGFDEKLRTADPRSTTPKILLSQHAIERLFTRHRNNHFKTSTDRFLHFLFAQILPTIFFLHEAPVDLSSAGEFGVSVNGGAFLCSVVDQGVAIKTFISEEQYRDDQETLRRPADVNILFETAAAESAVFKQNRLVEKSGAEYEVRTFELWGSSNEGLTKFHTEIVG